MLRYLLRGMKIGRQNLGAGFTTWYTRLNFRAQGVRIGKEFRSNGWPLLELSLRGHFTIGDGLHMNNGKRYNRIGRQHPCSFLVGKDARLTIGNNVGISHSAIVCHMEVTIGDGCRIGGNCVIYDTDFHDLDPARRTRIPEDFSGVKRRPVHIGKDVFIGAHSTILKGVTIGDSAIVGAGSMVTGDIPAGEIWGGNPARFIAKVL